ncbi:hypothetical protein H5410_027946 [Solanum commersonii]|uniref:Uncharacterized protein n=1 Tax=Solanum commersonii TaxID=4109 RepID=A0A9J5Z607_SOLCO|nr:hypothetical protein H5410_027946 [Solanum commersonii]
MLIIPFFKLYEYIIHYLTLDMAKSLENGIKVCFDMWYVRRMNLRMTQEIAKIGDLYPAPKFDLDNSWQMKKNINSDEIVVGILMIPFF